MQGMVRYLFLTEFFWNMAADISEDITSLEKVKIIPAGWLPKRTEYYSNWCQLILAGVEIVVSVYKRMIVDPTDVVKSKLLTLELVKFICDLGKGFYDCELSFSQESTFIGCGLVA